MNKKVKKNTVIGKNVDIVENNIGGKRYLKKQTAEKKIE